ncbi:TPA: hypothetical protein KNT04_002660 [Clostridioides difficile]|nr:hypothetical protein [Clostridioides difficile]
MFFSKFRIWDKDKEIMYEHDQIPLEANRKCILFYTDRYDSKGKEACMGDILKSKYAGFGIIEFGEYHQPCGNKHLGFYVKPLNSEYIRKDLIYWLDKSEIIGNKYENKNLLNMQIII